MAGNKYWYDKSNMLPDRQLIVNLFSWKWTDIANECENFLKHYGYGAVQITPPTEHLIFTSNNNIPWWVRWRPVSYQFESKSGNEAELLDMIERCNKVGVRIIVDVVLNHMIGVGLKSGVNGFSSSGSNHFDSTNQQEYFPGVPYTAEDFNDYRCDRAGTSADWKNNITNVKNCRAGVLVDLNQATKNVRRRITDFLNTLIEMGVAGFRLDIAQNMWTRDLKAIMDDTKNLRSDIFGANQRALIIYEVGPSRNMVVQYTDYLSIGRYTNFYFGPLISSAAQGKTDWKLFSNLSPNYTYGYGEDHDVVHFIDTLDTQRNDKSGVVTYKDSDHYRMAVSFMLAWPYGLKRVMSSYYFTVWDQGPPNTGANDGFKTTSPYFNSDLTCNSKSGWVCEHRWPSIRNMAAFHSVVSGTAVTEIFTDYNRIAFARNGKGFFALNGQTSTFSKYFQTTMPAGVYCDEYNGCQAKITVENDGTAFFKVPGKSIIAICLGSRLGGPPPTVNPITPSMSKTVIFLQKEAGPAEYMFIRGGLLHNNDCLNGPHQQSIDPCSIRIVHNTTVPFTYTEYLSWKQMDNYLDMEGAEEEQGTYDGQVAFGTPMALSTSDPTAFEYQPLNIYGPNYWMVQLYMDCGAIEEGWFEFKGYLSPAVGSEPLIGQGRCTGSIGGHAPFESLNHIAKCGAVNVFTFGKGDCRIDAFS